MASDLEFSVVQEADWNKAAPIIPPKPSDKYEPIINELEQGKILKLPVSDQTKLKGLRIVLGKRSKVKGFSLEYRTEAGFLYVKRSGEVKAKEVKVKKEKVEAK